MVPDTHGGTTAPLAFPQDLPVPGHSGHKYALVDRNAAPNVLDVVHGVLNALLELTQSVIGVIRAADHGDKQQVVSQRPGQAAPPSVHDYPWPQKQRKDHHGEGAALWDGAASAVGDARTLRQTVDDLHAFHHFCVGLQHLAGKPRKPQHNLDQ